MALQLAGKVCVVAGASSAIGEAIARRFCREGAHLALTYCSTRPEALLEEVSRGPGRVASFALDVHRWEEVQATIQTIEADFGRIHVLVNCTGFLGPIGPTHTLGVEGWVRTVETNLFGSFYLVRAVLPGMLTQGGGKILLLSGGGAAYARPFFTAYSASKAAVVRFTESLAEELRASNVQVNAIAPGPVKSRMWDQMRAARAVGGPRLQEELRQMDATGGVPSDRAAALALFLASDRSNGLTGRLISSIHDDWEDLNPHIARIMDSDAGTLRRVPLNPK